MRLGPATASSVYAAVTQKEAVKPLTHAPFGVLEVFARPFQVADLLLLIGHPHGGQPPRSGAIWPGTTRRADPS